MTIVTRGMTSRFPQPPLYRFKTTHPHTTRTLQTQPSRLPLAWVDIPAIAFR